MGTHHSLEICQVGRSCHEIASGAGTRKQSSHRQNPAKIEHFGRVFFFVSFQTIPIRIAIIIIIIITIVISILQPKEEEEVRRGSFCRDDRGVIFLKVTGFVCVFVFMFIFFRLRHRGSRE